MNFVGGRDVRDRSRSKAVRYERNGSVSASKISASYCLVLPWLVVG